MCLWCRSCNGTLPVSAQDVFAGVVHRFNIALEPSRRHFGAELSERIDSHREAVVTNLPLEDVTNKAAVVYVNACDISAYTDHINGRSDVDAGIEAQSRVVAAGRIACERKRTNRRAAVASGALSERRSTDRCVLCAGSIVKECASPGTRVVVAGGIEIKRKITGCRVVVTSAVKSQGARAIGCVEASNVENERSITRGCVVVAGLVRTERGIPVAVLLSPVVL